MIIEVASPASYEFFAEAVRIELMRASNEERTKLRPLLELLAIKERERKVGKGDAEELYSAAFLMPTSSSNNRDARCLRLLTKFRRSFLPRTSRKSVTCFRTTHVSKLTQSLEHPCPARLHRLQRQGRGRERYMEQYIYIRCTVYI